MGDASSGASAEGMEGVDAGADDGAGAEVDVEDLHVSFTAPSAAGGGLEGSSSTMNDDEYYLDRTCSASFHASSRSLENDARAGAGARDDDSSSSEVSLGSGGEGESGDRGAAPHRRPTFDDDDYLDRTKRTRSLETYDGDAGGDSSSWVGASSLGGGGDDGGGGGRDRDSDRDRSPSRGSRNVRIQMPPEGPGPYPLTASMPRGSLDASSLGGSSSEDDRLSPLQKIKTSVEDSVWAVGQNSGLSGGGIPRPPALLSVSSDTFRTAGVEYSSSKNGKKKKKKVHLMGKEMLKSISESLTRTLSARSSSSVQQEGEDDNDNNHVGGREGSSSTPRSSNFIRKGIVDSPSSSLGTASAGGGSPGNNKSSREASMTSLTASVKARRVSNLLWDLGGTWRGGLAGGGGSDLCSTDHTEATFESSPHHHQHQHVGGRLLQSSLRMSTKQQQQKQRQARNMSLYDPKSLAKIAEAEEARERARARRERFDKLCTAKVCAPVLFAIIVIGVVVGGMALVQGRWNATPPAAAPAVAEDDIVAELEAKCREANVRQWNGYKACHDICERGYCCFLEDWEAASCGVSSSEESSHCPAYRRLCPVLDSFDPDTLGSANDEEEALLASVKGHEQGLEAVSYDTHGGDVLAPQNSGEGDEDEGE